MYNYHFDNNSLFCILHTTPYSHSSISNNFINFYFLWYIRIYLQLSKDDKYLYKLDIFPLHLLEHSIYSFHQHIYLFHHTILLLPLFLLSTLHNSYHNHITSICFYLFLYRTLYRLENNHIYKQYILLFNCNEDSAKFFFQEFRMYLPNLQKNQYICYILFLNRICIFDLSLDINHKNYILWAEKKHKENWWKIYTLLISKIFKYFCFFKYIYKCL